MDKKELFQLMINALTEFQIIGEFDNGDVVVNFLPVGSAKSCDFEYVIFHEKKWYKVVVSEKNSKIKLFEQDDDVWQTVLSILKEDSLENGAMDLIDLARHFVIKTDKIDLVEELKGNSLWIAETTFGKLLGFINKDAEFASFAVEIDSELHFHDNYRGDNNDYGHFCNIMRRYYDAFIRDENSKYKGLTSKGKKLKF